MGNSLRCCLACVLPCGALDLIRIVHINGCVDELTGRVTAGEVLKNNPNHVLTKPCSQGMTRRILILSPESELKRGSIYFLIPASSLPAEKTNKILKKLSPSKKKSSPEITVAKLSEKKQSSRRHHRTKSNAGVWMPNLQTISED
ncbi:hypothetical protein C2S52_017043 [Perilla frutescens var. hirtella]|uniref:6,7-dimethyl-8-ribityllumazine synthase n=1 Tax=Perilla frutescens var. hirtella TaxID=608512 RepID=A0AAD4JPL9_PERFH|nr:hypothetical protein C2S52_017043 [Perilla frutescens var. hirtella]KAH6810850.1 hypothetical protein C2S51_024612 [Perilla frutescens var. frutescens]KAH6837079.1 hypothetical protein C2S53_015601 [Perilla frutescens var. hirtella]